jgi:methylase of polypeptide subunit release factors
VITPLLGEGQVVWLRDTFREVGYDRTGLSARLGEDAVAMCGGVPVEETLRRTTAGDRLDTLVRLFLCGQTVPPSAVDFLPAGADLLEPHGDGVRAKIEIHPYEDWWIVADVRPQLRPERPTSPDFVMCAGPVSTGLADATVRSPANAALDLGTGNGVQALHLSGHAGTVTGTDLSPRALRFAATTAALNGLEWELLEGDLAAPVAGRRFDLVVSNPPFVVGPGRTRLLYQDSGRPGDAMAAELARLAPDLLTEGGFLQYVSSWVHVRGEDWADRVRGWLPPGVDAWVIQGSVADPQSYVDNWLSQSRGAERDDWLEWFDAEGIEAVGTGLVSLRLGSAEGVVRVEDLRQEVDRPFGAQVLGWFARQDWLRAYRGERLLDACLAPADGLVLWQAAGHAGPAGWQLRRQVLSQQSGLHWTEDAEPLVVNLVGACDGVRPLRVVIKALAEVTGADAAALAEAVLPLVPRLVERGMLVSPSG